ncbi:MAG: hypothetical protein GY765_36810, partial [bacterium]|nr:hypothetical protein [bacterium]
ERLVDELAFIDNGKVFLRSPADDLRDNWRRVSFKLKDAPEHIQGAVKHTEDFGSHQVVSKDIKTTLKHLRSLGAEAVNEMRLPLDEIAVQIMKAGSQAEANQNKK